MVTVDHPSGIILSSDMLWSAFLLPFFAVDTMKLRRFPHYSVFIVTISLC